MTGVDLYTYYRSSAAWRVRIVLALKEVTYQPHYIHLLNNGGENWQTDYLAINPQGLVPTLQDQDSIITQSLAICEYLDEIHPEPPLLPAQAVDKAYVRSLAQIISCDIHPLNNLRVLEYLTHHSDYNEATRKHWYCHWIVEGFNALESLLERHRKHGKCCFADTPSLADACLIPQVYNAMRYDCNVHHFPLIHAIYEHCRALPEFDSTAPENQADAE